jgi:hypothetical protein
MYFKQQKFTSQNLVDHAAVFCVRNALKVTYEHLRFEKFFRGLYPELPFKGEEDIGSERKGTEGRAGIGREGRGNVERGGEGKEGREGSGWCSLASLGLATAL